MLILKSLLVCVVMMGMSKYAKANSIQEEWKEYTQTLSQSMNEWKKDAIQERKKLNKSHQAELLERSRQLQSEILNIENGFSKEIETLSKEMKFKSKQFQLKSDLALIRSIKIKRKYFNQKLKLQKKLVEENYKSEVKYQDDLREITFNSLKEQRDLLSNFNLNSYFKENQLKNLSEKKTCKIQKYFIKKQNFQDYFYSKFERVIPVEVEANYLIQKRKLLEEENMFLENMKSALNVMIEQIGKKPKELRRVERQLKLNRMQLVEVTKVSMKKMNELGFFKQTLKAAKLKRSKMFICKPLMKVSMRLPEVMNEHDKVGEVGLLKVDPI